MTLPFTKILTIKSCTLVEYLNTIFALREGGRGILTDQSVKVMMPGGAKGVVEALN